MSLQLRSITKDFTAKGGLHRAVDALSLEIEAGTFCTLLGPSGCGKTTLLRIIAGFEEPTAGDVVHRGVSLAGVPPYRRGFPMVFQSYALFPHLSVLDNVSYGLRVRGVPAAERTARAEQALALLGLETLRDRHPAQLSGGQQQRVALARCLVLEPEIILLDEPLSNLDAGLRVGMRREIRSLQQRLGITAVYVTHDQEEALAVSDRIVVMNAGRIEQDGTPAEVYHAPRSAFVARFMGHVNVFPVKRSDAGAALLGQVYESRIPDAAWAVVRGDAVQRDPRGPHMGRVAETAFLGARLQHVLELEDGTRVTLDEPAHAAAPATAAGDVVRFSIDVARVHFMPGDP
ncbi:MAG TPA: ABC transporter ATP-binding protein [Longimicrobiales bacterium]|nr:ABC transporter ATP-binding protein [Longimicrobiales bacterium]